MPKGMVTLKAHLLQSYKDFFIANQLAPQRWIYDRHTGEERMDDGAAGGLSFEASKWEEHKPIGYIADIGVRSHRLILPASFLISLGQSAGYIYYIDGTVPLDPVNFDEMMSMCQNMGTMFEQAGFKLKNKHDNLTEQKFFERGGLRDQYGQWIHDDPFPMKVTLEIKNFNRLPITSFTTPLADPTPASAAPTYLIDVLYTAESEVGSELFALKKARRFALTGDEQKAIPLRLWFEDPDWRPEGWQGKWIK